MTLQDVMGSKELADSGRANDTGNGSVYPIMVETANKAQRDV